MFPLRIQNAKYIEIGNHVYIRSKAWLVAQKTNNVIPSLIIDDYTVVGHFSHIVAVRDVYIGKNVLTADKVYISDNIHGYEDIAVPILRQPIKFKSSVHIGDNCWIGENSSILGAKIGKHCVIGANSVVAKNVPAYCVVAGVPAIVKKRYDFEKRAWIQVHEDR